MKKILISAVLLVAAALSLEAQPLTDDQIIGELADFPYRSGGCYCPYTGGDFYDTPPPSGYRPFYVSHLGRHGSRYQKENKTFRTVLSELDTLHRAGLLTASGDTLRNEIRQICNAHKGHWMILTDRGTREHTMIAENLVRRCPRIFKQKDRRTATFTTTMIQRTTQSLAGFEAGILRSAPEVRPVITSGFRNIGVNRDSDKKMSTEEMNRIVRDIEKSLSPSSEELARLRSLTVNDEDAASALVRDADLDAFIGRIFSVACVAGCLDIDVDPLRFFTPEELFSLYKVQDVRFNASYGVLNLTREARAEIGKSWARMIVDDADDAIEGNGHCADFRFAHDGNIGPMMNLLAIGPFQYTSEADAPYRNWQSYRYICMASNFQLIFYGNSRDDILVKALYNEREIDFPGLEATNNVYYKWADVRRYITSRTDEAEDAR